MRVKASDNDAPNLRVVDFYSGKQINGVVEADDDAGWVRYLAPGPVAKLEEHVAFRKITIERRNAVGEWVRA
jgi:hypothetical protein